MIDKDDGLRFLFIQSQDFKVTMHDELGEFPDMTLPSNLASVLSAMLMEQHQLRTEKKNNILKFKSVLEILEDEDDFEVNVDNPPLEDYTPLLLLKPKSVTFLEKSSYTHADRIKSKSHSPAAQCGHIGFGPSLDRKSVV